MVPDAGVPAVVAPRTTTGAGPRVSSGRRTPRRTGTGAARRVRGRRVPHGVPRPDGTAALVFRRALRGPGTGPRAPGEGQDRTRGRRCARVRTGGTPGIRKGRADYRDGHGADSPRSREPARLRARPGCPGCDQAGEQRGARCPRRPGCWRRSPRPRAGANRYPDLAVTGLTARLADEFGLDAARIAVGCGSVSLCQQLVSITCRGARRRGRLRVAVVRVVPDRDPGPGSDEADRAAGRGVPPRPRRDGRRGHAADPARVRLQPEQPDRDGGAPRRVRAVPRRGRPGRARRARRGLPRVRDRPRRRRRQRPARRATPTSSCCAPSPRPTGWPACAWATRWGRRRWRRRCGRSVRRSP